MIGTSTNTVGVKVESTTEEPAATVGQAAPSSSSSGFIKKKKRNASSYTHEANQPLQRNSVDTFSRSIEIVSKQLESATIQLQKSRDIDARLKLTTYIKSCADAIKALREIE